MRVLAYRDGVAVDCVVVADGAIVSPSEIVLAAGGSIAAPAGTVWMAGPVTASVGWHLDDAGAPIAPPVDPAAVIAATKAAYAAAVQARIDATAKSKNYTDGNSCASYATSTNAAWKEEAEAFVVWRDAVWTSVYATMAAVEAGTEPAPTAAALVAGLPTISWP